MEKLYAMLIIDGMKQNETFEESCERLKECLLNPIDDKLLFLSVMEARKANGLK